jgi:hypothetical protein
MTVEHLHEHRDDEANWMHPEVARRGGLVVDLLEEAERLLGHAMAARWVEALMICLDLPPDTALWQVEGARLAQLHGVITSCRGDTARKSRMLQTIERARGADLEEVVAEQVRRAAPDGADTSALVEQTEPADPLAEQLARLYALTDEADLARSTVDEWLCWRLYAEGAETVEALGAARLGRLCEYLEGHTPGERVERVTAMTQKARDKAGQELALTIKQAAREMGGE